MASDPGTTTRTAGTFLNNRALGGIDFVGDLDWFKLSAQANTQYDIILSGYGSTQLDTGTLRLVDSKGVDVPDIQLLDEFGDGLYGIRFINGAKAGTYYLEVEGETDSPDEVLQYAITLTTVKDDFADSTKGAGFIGRSNLINGAVQWYNDKDWFKFSALADTRYTVTLNPNLDADNQLSAGSLRLLDSKGLDVPEANYTFTKEENGLYEIQFVNPDKAGTYYVEVSGETDEDDTYPISYQLSLAPEKDDFGSTTKTAGTVSKLGYETGMLQWDGDRDWFKLSALANSSYTITLDNSDFTARLLDSKGGDLPIDAYVEDEGVITFKTGVKAATYFIEVSSTTIEDYSTQDYTYNFSVQKIEDDFGDTTKSAGTFSSTGLMNGHIQWEEDADWIKFSAKADTQYSFNLSGYGSTEPLTSAKLTLLDSKGTEITDGFSEPEVFDVAGTQFVNKDKANTYYISISGETNEDVGQYQLTMQTLEDDFGSTTKTAETIRISGSDSGEIQWIDDKDWMRFAAKADTQYIFETASDEVVLNILDSKGVALLPDDFDDLEDEGFFGVKFIAKKSGIYYIEVAANPDAEFIGEYSVTSDSEADDYIASTKTTGLFKSVGRTPVEVSGEIQWANDADWIKLTAASAALYRLTLDGTDLAINLYDAKGNDISDAVNVEINEDSTIIAFFNDTKKATPVYLSVAAIDETIAETDSVPYTVTAEVYLWDEHTGDTELDAIGILASLADSNFWS